MKEYQNANNANVKVDLQINNNCILMALLFGGIFLIGGFVDRSLGSECYTLDWITRNHLYIIAALLSIIPTLLSKWKFGFSVLAGTVIGLICAEVFGPDPQGAALGFSHHGWSIWLGVFFASIVCGTILEILSYKRNKV